MVVRIIGNVSNTLNAVEIRVKSFSSFISESC